MINFIEIQFAAIVRIDIYRLSMEVMKIEQKYMNNK